MRLRSIQILLAALLVACGGENGDGDAGIDGATSSMDGGAPMDAAVDAEIPVDASPDVDAATTDAGGSLDGGGEDAAAPDDGGALDAGTESDAGGSDAGVDAGPSDAGPPDGGATADAGGGCTVNGDCASGQYCRKTVGDCGGIGACVGRPGICPAVFMPVCGCNGMTYSNSCVAGSAGVSVASDGACGSSS